MYAKELTLQMGQSKAMRSPWLEPYIACPMFLIITKIEITSDRAAVVDPRVLGDTGSTTKRSL